MKNKLQKIGLIPGMIFLYTGAFGQINKLRSEKIKEDKVTETYFGILINAVSTNLNYGKSNGALSTKSQTYGC
jgi:hypothetical protein